TRHLDDAALDGVEQPEIGDDPGKQLALTVSRAAQEERRRRQIVDRLDAELALERLDTSDPDMRRLVVFFRFGAFLTCQYWCVFLFPNSASIAVMRFIVQNDDILATHEVGAALTANARNHLT